MKLSGGPDQRLEAGVARVLEAGTWLSCALIVLGLVVAGSAFHARHISAGIWTLIALPVLRVGLMGVWFMIHRERVFAAIAGAVLCIILLSTFWGAVAG